ncbi:helix-turn-helix domain-containing protein [Okeania sp. SIO1I7]|uniref:helix-turn-helix domain-containing protein n=1 Tax=Okeania sp. SIO1I7 TaxID=2607772 RepID=UPI003451C8F4
MRTAYQYKLRPNKEQLATIEMWLELLRRQYNYRLGQQFSWWEENRNIKNRAAGHSVLKARGTRCSSRATKREAHTIAPASVWEYVTEISL